MRESLFFLAALPVVLRAGIRVRRLRNAPLDERVRRLRDAPVLRWRWLRDPHRLHATTVRLLRRLPNRTRGPCLQRSLILLDLWSRCGLSPRLHLGLRASGPGRREGHAWVTAEPGEISSPEQGFRTAFTF